MDGLLVGPMAVAEASRVVGYRRVWSVGAVIKVDLLSVDYCVWRLASDGLDKQEGLVEIGGIIGSIEQSNRHIPQALATMECRSKRGHIPECLILVFSHADQGTAPVERALH